MRNYRMTGAVTALLVCVLTREASGQTGYIRPPAGPFTRPAVSPYLNLTRPGNTTLNYYNLVRPEFEFRNAYQGLQRQVNRDQAAITQLGEAGIPATGHATGFLSYSHYYSGLRGGGSTGGLGRTTSPFAVSRPGQPSGSTATRTPPRR